jgi:hypothetical protein
MHGTPNTTHTFVRRHDFLAGDAHVLLSRVAQQELHLLGDLLLGQIGDAKGLFLAVDVGCFEHGLLMVHGQDAEFDGRVAAGDSGEER